MISVKKKIQDLHPHSIIVSCPFCSHKMLFTIDGESETNEDYFLLKSSPCVHVIWTNAGNWDNNMKSREFIEHVLEDIVKPSVEKLNEFVRTLKYDYYMDELEERDAEELFAAIIQK